MDLIESINNVFNTKAKLLSSNINHIIKYKVSTKKLNVGPSLTRLNDRLKGKVFDTSEEYQPKSEYDAYSTLDQIPYDLPKFINITSSNLSKHDKYYTLTLIYRPVDIYLSDKILPVDIINYFIGSITDGVDFINFIRSVDVSAELITYELFYKSKYPEEYNKVRHVVNELYKITHVKPWKELYSNKLSPYLYVRESDLIRIAVKIYDMAPSQFDNFIKVFVDFHLGSKSDYEKWLLFFRTIGIPMNDDVFRRYLLNTQVYPRDVLYHTLFTPSISLMSDIIMGRVTLNNDLLKDMNTDDAYGLKEYVWFLDDFIPYVASLQLKYTDIDYMSYIPYDVLLYYVKRNFQASVITVTLELGKRKPNSALKDILDK